MTEDIRTIIVSGEDPVSPRLTWARVTVGLKPGTEVGAFRTSFL